MPAFGPVSHRDIVRYLRQAGFEGPFSGGKHPFMVRDDVVLTLPNPHGPDIGRELLARILRQAGITRAEWEAL